ncbi:zinc-binding alcohol dehydrogenase family protein [Aspergillus novofumigatus IBT 16806]|uniref:Putative alcohol dehydrogenase n=1 Tax=Aspergillus novofumigatus (strain IBT 16806) TaxID=1392255 RepID=A0A2I1BSL5_ASPN1|nr:putative alcohol dehydrogenase [Aspergillus novofumigatus IBT 16806]PKX88369.1 putative alcohol dehydrogenase [Aspergillus novofumigatus IBT 16806]
MSSVTGNEAAWIPAEKAKCEVGPGPLPKPAENEVVIEVAYAAVNPIDYLMQDTPYVSLPYPSIFGSDVAGTIVQLGSSVTRFKVGQRVIGECDNLLTQNPSHSGFQRFATCAEIMVAVIPHSLPLANAAVLPLCYSTAGCALFKHLKLPLPSLDPKPVEKTILLWGGSSSVGCSAIQLAVAAGLTVVTTARAENHDLVKRLGAKHVFDYKSLTVIEDILKVLKKGDLVMDCISVPTTQVICTEIVHTLGGGKLPALRWPEASKYDDVEIIFVNGGDPVLVDLDIGDALWRRYLPEALATGKFVPKPDPEIIEGGLGKVQEGIDIVRKGVSAKKIVIEVSKKA